ncbi:MAG TPA: hypothetical protein VMJ66_01940 [Geobacteraceae bacterium]|nr:hypothetical protein [Geobacteraceae bacterium]
MEKRDKNKPEMELTVIKDEFSLYATDDFARVDNLCKGLLLRFYEQLQQEGLSPEEATELANSADYFVRDFVVDFKAFNLFDEMPGIVRQFAGNWYIAKTLEPDIRQLSGHLRGIRAFYRFLHGHGLISAGYMRNIEKECDELPFYESRIASFWEIKDDGYYAWERECSLREGDVRGGHA